jgi:hypothetical protein
MSARRAVRGKRWPQGLPALVKKLMSSEDAREGVLSLVERRPSLQGM